jgi:hypothetical protein
MKTGTLLFRNRIKRYSSQRPEYWSQLIKKIKKIFGREPMQQTGMILIKPFWNELDYIGIDAYFPLSNATTPSVLELNDRQQHIKKIEKLQEETKKISTEFGYRNSDQAARTLGKKTQLITRHNAYESFQTLTQKNGLRGGCLEMVCR